MAKRKIHAATKPAKLIAMQAEVKITAAEAGDDGKPKGPPTFDVVAYTGGAMNLKYWDAPVVVDLGGLTFGKSLVANLDHDASKRVGHVTKKTKADGQLSLGGIVSAATDAAREVVESSANGFVWQASIEANPDEVSEIKAGKTVKVNGTEFQGPIYVTRKSTLTGFAFVSHGADDNTSVRIAAVAASSKQEKDMDPELQAWIEAMLPGIEISTLTAEQVSGLKANYAGKNGGKPAKRGGKLEDGLQAKQAETDRVDAITEIALNACDKRPYDIQAIKAMAERSIEGKWTVEKFRLELLEASLPPAHTVFRTKRDERMSDKVIEAAICMTGRLDGIEGNKSPFDEQTLEAAHKHFRNGIGLKQLFLMCAESNGYRASYSQDITLDVQRAAFGMTGPRQIHATGFSTIDIATILSNTANKFLREGWMGVDGTAERIAFVRSVRDFKEITTVSLTGDLMFEKLGADGQIKHGTLDETTYGNKAETYARMLAITRQDMINDDIGALTTVPRRLGRGGRLKLNDIFWAEFLDNATFFTSGNNNVVTGAGSALSLAGLGAAEVKFLNQNDPDGKPLGLMPEILLAPPSLRATAMTLMNSQAIVGTTTANTLLPSANIWQGRFRVESSPYMENSSYTGYSAAAWYLLASPSDMPVIEIAALNGRVEPIVETADADFNVLGVQMRGYSDVGVRLQEPRGGVRSAGS